ncbi:Tubby- protein 3 [Rhizophlyctis rosea]|nr:Tubby- protein 3 [Rhizophlyctis rosea]
MPVDTVRGLAGDPVEDPQVQLKLLKKELKAWENAFAEREGRKPGSNDIKQDKEIARRYKAYVKLKNAASAAGKGDATGSQKDLSQQEEEEPPARITKGNGRDSARDLASPEPQIVISRNETYDIRPATQIVIPTVHDVVEPFDQDSDGGRMLQSYRPISPATPTGGQAWGPKSELPGNFKLRRDTIGAGPMPTATLEGSVRPGSGRRVTVGDGARPDESAARANEPASAEFLDFMNRRKQLENLGPANPPPGAVSAAEALKAVTSPASPVRPVVVTPVTVKSSPISAAPDIDNSLRPMSPPPSTANRTPLTAQELRELAKPFDPTEEIAPLRPAAPVEAIRHLDINRDRTSTPTSQKASTPSSQASPARATTPSSGWGEGDEDKEDAQHAVVPLTPATAAAIGEGIQTSGQNVAKLPSLVNVKIFFRIQPEGILRCRLYRKKNVIDKKHPTFYLYNEADDSFLLAARKRKKSKVVNYVISTSQDDMSKESKHYVGKLKANAQRTNFILYDARSYNKSTANKGLRELAAVSYSKTVLPREMSVAIPATKIEELSDDLSKDIMADVKAQNADKLLFLKNKSPRWNETTQSHCLNFGGRVTQPSIKNFQLIGDVDDSYIVLQFGRCGSDYFTLDARFPITPIEAFAVALTTFDAYDSA